MLMSNPPTNSRAAETLFQAALVCGAGRNATTIVKDLLAGASEASSRTCIDGGSSVLLVVRAPGDRAFDVCIRQPAPVLGVHHWRRTRMLHGSSETWDTRLFLGAPQLAPGEARRVTNEAGASEAFTALHSRLGPNARLFLTSIQEKQDIRQVWIGWHLDKQFTPRRAFTACGLRDAWTAVEPTIGSVLGKDVPSRSQGWSMMASFGEHGLVFRLGTTLWSRVPESSAKLAGFRDAIARLGGSRSYAESLYRLLLPENSNTGFTSPTGCALELEIDPSGIVSTDFFLRLNSALAIAHHQRLSIAVANAA